MVQITDFPQKWELYKPRAHRFSLHFREGERLTQDAVAARIPRDTSKTIPATDSETIAGAAVGNWLNKGELPDDRVGQWEELTGLPIAVWTVDVAGFGRTLRQRTGDVLGWAGLVQQRATHGRLRIRPEDPPAPQARSGCPPRRRLRQRRTECATGLARLHRPHLPAAGPSAGTR